MLEFLPDVNIISIYFCKPFMSVMMLRFLFMKIRKPLYFTSDKRICIPASNCQNTFLEQAKNKEGYPKDIFL